jgi:hypothetical protein
MATGAQQKSSPEEAQNSPQKQGALRDVAVVTIIVGSLQRALNAPDVNAPPALLLEVPCPAVAASEA